VVSVPHLYIAYAPYIYDYNCVQSVSLTSLPTFKKQSICISNIITTITSMMMSIVIGLVDYSTNMCYNYNLAAYNCF